MLRAGCTAAAQATHLKAQCYILVAGMACQSNRLTTAVGQVLHQPGSHAHHKLERRVEHWAAAFGMGGGVHCLGPQVCEKVAGNSMHSWIGLAVAGSVGTIAEG